MGSPFHEGEIAVQARAGVRDTAERVGRMLAPAIMPAALPFLADQRLVAVAAAAPDGAVWTSAWFGEPGFATSDDGTRLVFTRALARPHRDDPVEARIAPGGRLGVLAIDLATRRRLRVNGTVEAITGETLEVAVEEAFPNCPKHIRPRRVLVAATAAAAGRSREGDVLDDERRALIARVETLFVGSRHPVRGVDASHRGGSAGFVRTVDASTIRIPDYRGNTMFQTLGNLAVDPRAGAALLDVTTNRLLCLTGVASIVHDREDPDQPTGGTGRYWELTIGSWRELELPAGVRFEPVE